jgi:HlyD family secretion protein
MHQQVAMPKIVRRKKRKWRRWLFGGLALLVVAVGLFFTQRKDTPLVVTTEKAAIRDITQLVSATGKIRPEVEVKISPEVAGEIIELPVVDGQHVRKGDLLVRIKPDNYIAQVKQAQASLSAAQADSLQRKAQMLNDELDLHRSQELFGKRLVSETDFKGAQTKSDVSKASYEASLHQIDMARSSVDQSRDLLNKCVIYSPVDGTISALNSELGERVVATGSFAGTEVMRVANLDSMEARVDVNENDVVNVKVNDPVRVQVDSYPGRQFTGRVKQIASTATVKNEGSQQEVTNFEVRIVIRNPEVQLRPGMSVNVDVETQTVKQVVSAPVQSVTVRVKDNGKTAEQMQEERHKEQGGVSSLDADKADRRRLERVVFLRQNNMAKLARVQTGIADSSWIQIISGVQSGDEVISGPYNGISKELKDGAKVKIEPPKNAK